MLTRLLTLVILFFQIASVYLLGSLLDLAWYPQPASDLHYSVIKGQGLHSILEETLVSPEQQVSFSGRLYARISGGDRRILTGRYRFGGEISPAQIVEQLTNGPNDPLRVIIPPGYTLEDCARALAKAGCIDSPTDLVTVATRGWVLEIIGAPSLEGLVAPETYFFDERIENETECLEILHEDWVEFASRVAGTSDLAQRGSNGLTLYETLIVASIVEREAARHIEMPTAASVFHNRIQKRMPLGSAATLRYALGDWEGEDHKLPVNLDSPYNTSRKAGLPPTPICIPSESALRAALHPPKTEFLFFVADGDGGLIFNRTHNEHRDSVKSYRDKMASRKKTAGTGG